MLTLYTIAFIYLFDTSGYPQSPDYLEMIKNHQVIHIISNRGEINFEKLKRKKYYAKNLSLTPLNETKFNLITIENINSCIQSQNNTSKENERNYREI